MTALLREELVAAMSRQAINDRLVVTPLLDEVQQVGPGTIDLRLGTEFIEILRRSEAVIDPLAQSQMRAVGEGGEEAAFVPLGEHFVLHPGQFVLGSTLEFIRLPSDISGQVLSRSSWGRLGLIVATAVVVQPGFAGMLTLELVNAGSVPMRLYPGLRIAQLQLWKAERATTSPYDAGMSSKYQAPLGPESNRLAWETAERDKIRSIGEKLAGGIDTSPEVSE